MAKKKMTPAQAAAARRPKDWEPPQGAQTSKKKTRQRADTVDVRPEADGGRQSLKLFVPVIVAAFALAIVTPFIVYFLSNLLGLPGA